MMDPYDQIRILENMLAQKIKHAEAAVMYSAILGIIVGAAFGVFFTYLISIWGK